MSTLKILQNGVKKVANRRRKRRNTAVATKTVANKRRRRRRNTASVVRRNTTATKTVANKRRRRRRNTATLTTLASNRRRHHKRRRRNGITRSRNGILGNSKETIYSVGSLLFGLGAVKVEAPLVMPMVANILTPLGFGQYARPLTEAGLAVVNSWVAGMIAKKIKVPQAPKMVLIGGLAMAAMDLVVAFLPSANAYNPFAVANVAPVLPAGNAGDTAAAMSGFMAPRIGRGYRRPVVM